MSDAEDAPPPRPREGGWGDESGTSAPAPRPGRRRRSRHEEKEATPPPASSAEVGGAAEEDDEQDLPKKPSSGWGDEDNGKTNDFKPAGRRNRGGGAESKEASTASTGRCEGPAVDGVFSMKPCWCGWGWWVRVGVFVCGIPRVGSGRWRAVTLLPPMPHSTACDGLPIALEACWH